MEHLYEQEQAICGLLDEAGTLLPRLEEMGSDDAEDLYGLLTQAVRFTSKNMKLLSDTELRVALCEYRDIVLDSIIDRNPAPPLIDAATYRQPKKVYAPYHHGWEFWGNEYLLKDTGIAPYMIAKAVGATPVLFFGRSGADYPYVEFLPGLEFLTMEYSDDYSKRREQYLGTLLENMLQLDVLALHGPYGEALELLYHYRRLRPKGRVYITLDMNSDWQSRIDWSMPQLAEFFDKCDVIANSCRTMRDSINRDPNVNFGNFWISNAFFNAYGVPIVAKPKLKENVILTVGRIGTEQKNNEELLLAFAKAADALPSWRIHLVGSVDDRIKPFIAKYFEIYPKLKSRVIFKGKIVDKKQLYREYSQAKVFILTSALEGGTPNVYAEALHHGCAFITSDIDGADDITDYGRLGSKYKLGDADALAGAMVRLCRKADNTFFKSHIPAALEYANRYFDWDRNAKKIAYALYH
jgi:glycosyltransferase involved in cell wall biosynthesis